jgi:signal transduction histidine kinase
VPERLFAIADTMVEPERYRARMLELAAAPSDASIDEFEVAATGRVFRGYTAPVPDVEGGLGGRIWTLREVTADRELDRMRDAFVATVSHELRTPLTSISGFLEMMQDEEDRLDDTGRQYLNVIRRSTERLYSLVEDLLLVAQIEAKRVELNLADVDVAELAARAVEVRLTQVLDNLVSNAVKFTDRDGVVTVTVNGNGDGVELVVEDTGIGVSSEEQGQVFTRFFRASTATKRAVPGTGLGLAISRALVEQHGGTISFSSREGEGTTVTVRLPAQTDR